MAFRFVNLGPFPFGARQALTAEKYLKGESRTITSVEVPENGSSLPLNPFFTK